MMNIIYFIVFSAIVLLWRPTDNNERYGLQQLGEIDDGLDMELEIMEGDEEVFKWAEDHCEEEGYESLDIGDRKAYGNKLA